MTLITSKTLITTEVEKLIQNTQKSYDTVQKFAISEAWKLLQLVTSSVIQIIEAIGKDLEGPEKKELALKLIGDFYDKVFIVVDVPMVPNIVEPLLHRYVKAFLIILVGSTIDSMVTIFRNTGVFLKKEISNKRNYNQGEY